MGIPSGVIRYARNFGSPDSRYLPPASKSRTKYGRKGELFVCNSIDRGRAGSFADYPIVYAYLCVMSSPIKSMAAVVAARITADFAQPFLCIFRDRNSDYGEKPFL